MYLQKKKKFFWKYSVVFFKANSKKKKVFGGPYIKLKREIASGDDKAAKEFPSKFAKLIADVG